MEREGVLKYLQRQIKSAGMAGKLIAVNAIVFLFFIIIRIVSKLYVEEGLLDDVVGFFAVPSDPGKMIYRPWTLITNFFTHVSLLHFLMNMLVLFFTSKIFVQFFGERRLLTTYFLGGIFGYGLHAGAYYAFPLLGLNPNDILIGASGAVMAIFFAISVYQPALKVNLFGVLPVPLLAIAGLYLLSDLLGIGKDDNIGHFVHLGGAIFGAVSVINAHSPKNFMNRLERLIFKLKLGGFKKKERKPKMKVYQTNASQMTDEEYNTNKVKRQARVDAILEKVRVKGYDGLSKEEKDILFNESKR